MLKSTNLNVHQKSVIEKPQTFMSSKIHILRSMADIEIH